MLVLPVNLRLRDGADRGRAEYNLRRFTCEPGRVARIMENGAGHTAMGMDFRSMAALRQDWEWE